MLPVYGPNNMRHQELNCTMPLTFVLPMVRAYVRVRGRRKRSQPSQGDARPILPPLPLRPPAFRSDSADAGLPDGAATPLAPQQRT